MLVKQVLPWLKQQLQPVVNSPEQLQAECQWFVEEVLNLKIPQLMLKADDELSSTQEIALEQALVMRIEQRLPVQYVFGAAYFMGHRFKVSPAVLIPRPETEELVLQGLAHVAGLKSPKVLDIGTGSGCIAISVALACVQIAVTAVDIAEESLKIARENARLLEAVQVQFLHSNWLDAVPEETQFDLILSNPPYIPRSEAAQLTPEVQHEPERALFIDESPQAFYTQLLGRCLPYLAPNGLIIMELGDTAAQTLQLPEVNELLRVDSTILPDLQGLPRYWRIKPLKTL